MTSPTILNTTDLPEIQTSVSGYTPKPETVGSSISHVVLVIAYLFIIVTSVAGNGIVILSVITCRRMRTVTNYFLVSLASADLMMAVLCIPFTFIANWLVDRWPFGTAMCPIVPYLQSIAVFLSAFTLVGLVAKTGLVCHPGWTQCRSVSCGCVSSSTSSHSSSSFHRHRYHLAARSRHSTSGPHIFPCRDRQRPL